MAPLFRNPASLLLLVGIFLGWAEATPRFEQLRGGSLISNDVNLPKPAEANMVSLFSSTEAIYDRYAACIAATEPLRANRDRKAHSSLPSFAKFLTAKTTSASGLCTARNVERYPGVRDACTQHIVKSSKVIRSLGMSVAQFNAISRRIESDAMLRERVMEQAYLYRLSATLKFDKLPLLEDPASEALLAAQKRRRVQMFAKSLSEIEVLRVDQTEALKKALNVRALPTNFKICDPFLLPLLSPKIQNMCNDFPVQAEGIVKEFGLNSDEFNKMLNEAKRNLAFRWRVNHYVKKLGELEKKDKAEKKKKGGGVK